MNFVVRFLHRALEQPLVFELQQRLFNNYSAVAVEFAEQFARRGQRILDVGCSTGTCAGQIVDMVGNEYVGIDANPRYVETAARRFPKGRFVAADARKTALPAASFDLVMFIGVMHHMDDELVRGCLAEMRRVAKPGGHVIVAEPVFTPGRWLSNLLLSMDRGEHIRDEAGYRGLFTGYRVERQRYFNFSFHRFCSFVLSPSVAA